MTRNHFEVLGVPRDYTLGNAQQWTLTLQRALPRSILLEVDYLGSKSTHFDRPAEYNLINVQAGQKARALSKWGDVEFIDTDASGTYEGLVTKVEKRMSNRYQFLTSYTLSKAEDDNFIGTRVDVYGYSKVRRAGTIVITSPSRVISTSTSVSA